MLKEMTKVSEHSHLYLIIWETLGTHHCGSGSNSILYAKAAGSLVGVKTLAALIQALIDKENSIKFQSQEAVGKLKP